MDADRPRRWPLNRLQAVADPRYSAEIKAFSRRESDHA
jgi:hypothetical protein